MTRVLVLDADDAIRDSMSLILEDEGYTVLVASDVATALDLLYTCPDCLVVLLDISPAGSAAGGILTLVASQLELISRHAYVCLTTSTLLSSEAWSALTRLSALIVAKPFDIDDLLATVRRAEEHLPLPVLQREDDT